MAISLGPPGANLEDLAVRMFRFCIAAVVVSELLSGAPARAQDLAPSVRAHAVRPEGAVELVADSMRLSKQGAQASSPRSNSTVGSSASQERGRVSTQCASLTCTER